MNEKELPVGNLFMRVYLARGAPAQGNLIIRNRIEAYLS